MDSPLVVYLVICVAGDDREQTHVFSTMEKARAFCKHDPRNHIVTDYLVDHPEQLEERLQ